MTAPAGPEVRLRGSRCLCRGCGNLFGSPSAFDRHQRDDGRPAPCIPVHVFSAPGPNGERPRLTWHPAKGLWVTKLDRRFTDAGYVHKDGCAQEVGA